MRETGDLELFAEHLVNSRQQIVSRWREEAKHDMRTPSAHKLSRQEFENNIPTALKMLARSLNANEIQYEKVDNAALHHGQQRWKHGYELKEVIYDWNTLTNVLFQFADEFWRTQKGACDNSRQRAIELISSFSHEAIAQSVEHFDAIRRVESSAQASDIQRLKEQFEAIARERAQLIREAAHDLRGQLTPLVGSAELMRTSHQMTEEMRTALADSVVDSSENIQRMLADLLALVRIEAGADERSINSINASSTIRSLCDTLSSMAEKNDLEMKVEIEGDIEVEGDSEKIRRIAQNLIINAIKYTNEGHIFVGVARRDEQVWRLIVRDTGPGLQSFDGSAFVQALDNPGSIDNIREEDNSQWPGEGIGLTIVKRLCELLYASIHVESHRGEGTCFYVDFPCHYEE